MLCFIISRKWNHNWKARKNIVYSMEKLLWLIECVKTGLWIFMRGVSHKMMLHGWVGSWCSQWSNGDINWEQSVSYHVGDSHHTQNVQISNGTGEKKSKKVSFMLQKTKHKQRGILVIPIEYQLELKRKKKRERERERENHPKFQGA